jgi:hypothetical protein
MLLNIVCAGVTLFKIYDDDDVHVESLEKCSSN